MQNISTFLKFKNTPDWGISPVPAKQRILGFTDLFALWGDLSIGLTVILAGSFLIPGLNFYQALLDILLGTIAGCIILALVGMIGSRTHLPTMVILRSILGFKGSIIPSSLNIVQLTGWTTFEFIIMGYTANAIFKALTGFSNYYIFVTIVALIVIIMNLLNMTSILRVWLKRFAFWIVIITTVWLTVHILSKPGILGLLKKPGDGSLTFWGGFDLVIAMPISWLPLVADYTRFAKNERSASIGTFLSFSLGNIWLYTIGALLILTTTITQETRGFVPALLSTTGWFALLILLIDETKEAWADLYSAAVSGQNIFSNVSHEFMVIIFGFIAFILAVCLDVTQYQNFLYLIGSVFIPLFSMLIADYFVLNKGMLDVKNLYMKNNVKNIMKLITAAVWVTGIIIYQVVSRKFLFLSASLTCFTVVFLVYIFAGKIINEK